MNTEYGEKALSVAEYSAEEEVPQIKWKHPCRWTMVVKLTWQQTDWGVLTQEDQRYSDSPWSSLRKEQVVFWMFTAPVAESNLY